MPKFFSHRSTSISTKKWGKPTLAVTVLALSCAAATRAHANDWWFDVEVIVFKRDIATQSIAESFDHQGPKFASPTALDLLSDYISPNLTYVSAGLPVCDVSVGDSSNKQDPEGEQPVALVNEIFTVADFSYLETPLNPPTESVLDMNSAANVPDSLAQVDGNNSDDEELSGSQDTDLVSYQYTMTPPKWVNWQLPATLPCSFSQDRILLAGPYDRLIPDPQPTSVPLSIDGVEWPNRRSAYLLPKSEQQLAKLEEHIRWQKDLTPILHVTWRQPVVFGHDNAQPFKLIAGKNYATEFAQDGQRKIEKVQSENQDSRFLADDMAQQKDSIGLSNDTLFAQINAALRSPEPAKIVDLSEPSTGTNVSSIDQQDFTQVAEQPLWQLEGDFSVYLQNVGRTPYLHIDSNLDFRAPITLALPGEIDVKPNNFLQSYHFDQLRRVISKQLHYFDHPLFGMVVQIRRYEPPKSE
ncbi:CsiV family protein [Paraglaciecola sp. 20A4]|uniref:CsiV family protein n=1 Tax=Paraglaciecola sp. 20A4 TaxID=2687288 RepID=UPI00140A1B66|nr:CsiV family protein [Paraglaciecola sp. 20A4]